MVRNQPERRRSHRTRVNLEVELAGIATGESEGTLVTETLNLSTEGVYCTVPRFIPPLTRVALALFLPREPGLDREPGRAIQCEAVAVRTYPERESPGCSAYEVACYFTTMTPEDRQALAEYLGVAVVES